MAEVKFALGVLVLGTTGSLSSVMAQVTVDESTLVPIGFALGFLIATIPAAVRITQFLERLEVRLTRHEDYFKALGVDVDGVAKPEEE